MQMRYCNRCCEQQINVEYKYANYITSDFQNDGIQIQIYTQRTTSFRFYSIPSHSTPLHSTPFRYTTAQY